MRRRTSRFLVRRSGVIPNDRELLRQLEKARSVGRHMSLDGNREILNSALQCAHSGQSRVPPSLERLGHQSILRLDGVVLPLDTLRLVACFAQFELHGMAFGL